MQTPVTRRVRAGKRAGVSSHSLDIGRMLCWLCLLCAFLLQNLSVLCARVSVVYGDACEVIEYVPFPV